MRRLVCTLILMSALLAACSKHASDTAAPVVPSHAPALLATQPAARAPSAIYDGDIWAQFDRPLDARTVTTQTVFLKLDGQRATVVVSYDGITHRVLLHPITTLELQRTYTVDFTTAIKGADGTPLPPDVFFQFTTNSLRRFAYDYPAQDALEGPVVCLGWGGAKGPDGNILYEVYAAPDSDGVASRGVPFLQRTVFTRLLPTTPWPLGQRLFWAVTSENVTTHERMDGAVHAFRTIDESAPLDSVVLRPNDFGSNDIRSANAQFCSNTVLPAGPSFNAGLHWNFTGLTPDMRLASATMKLYFTDLQAGNFNATQPSVWLAQNEWNACAMRAPGPPFNELTGRLADAIPANNFELDFTSARLAALLEAQYRKRTLLFGTLVRSQVNTIFHSNAAFDAAKQPKMVVRFHRVPPGAAH